MSKVITTTKTIKLTASKTNKKPKPLPKSQSKTQPKSQSNPTATQNLNQKIEANSDASSNGDTPMENTSIWDEICKQVNDITEIPTGPVVYQSRPDNLDDHTLEPKIQPKSTKSVVCYSCDGDLLLAGAFLVCKRCGLEIPNSTTTDDDSHTNSNQDCNVNDRGFISMKIIGKGSYGYNRSMLKSCADYSRYRKMHTLKEIHNWNAQSSSIHLPKNVIEEANNMFAKIKDNGHVYRKDVKKGVQSACLYYACYMNGISKTPNEIASLVGIEEKFHSMGDRILRDLNEKSIINLPAKINPIVDYIERYFELLNIPKKYQGFVLDIIETADRHKLHVLYDSKNNTKCIGTIYMLIDRVSELSNIDKEKIDEECQISKTTFMKYYNMLCKFYRKFVPVFIKHRICMKSEWFEDIPAVIAKSTIGDYSTAAAVKKTRKATVKKKNLSSVIADALSKPDEPINTAPIKRGKRVADVDTKTNDIAEEIVEDTAEVSLKSKGKTKESKTKESKTTDSKTKESATSKPNIKKSKPKESTMTESTKKSKPLDIKITSAADADTTLESIPESPTESMTSIPKKKTIRIKKVNSKVSYKSR